MGERRLSLLDGLRGFAALSVVLWHYRFFFVFWPDGHRSVPNWDALQPGRPFLDLFYDHGLRAVELFWLISGFIFTAVYCFGKSATTREFVANRFARLYPLHVVTLIVMLLLQAAASAQFGAHLIFTENDVYHFVLNLLLVSAWGLQRGASFNDVIWSVSVEIAVYGAFWALHGKLVRWGVAGALLIVGIFGFVVLLNPPTFIFACGFYFFVGSALALAGARLRQRRGGNACLALALALMGGAALAHGEPLLSQVIGLPGVFGAAVLMLTELDGRAGERLSRAAQWIGDCSYGIYLWHVPLLLAVILLISPFADVSVLATEEWFLVAYLLAVLLLARVSYVCFECPARRHLRRFAGRVALRQPTLQGQIGG